MNIERRRRAIKPADYHLYSSIEYLPQGSKRAVINLDALKHNWRVLCRVLSRDGSAAHPIAVVKADAYGHGAPQCVRALLEVGCDFFAVSCLEEAVVVRRVTREAKKNADVLILGHTPPVHAPLLERENLIQTLISPTYAEELSAVAEAQHLTLRTHVALNTGMNRIGFDTSNADEIENSLCAIQALFRRKNICVTGMFTHFATANGNLDTDRALFETQVKRYQAVRSALADRGIEIPFHHVCNSTATITSPELHFDGVRAGILLYGGILYPTLRPVMRLECDIVHVCSLSKGESVGYGAKYTAESDRTIAVLPIGYADGLTRSMSGARITLKTASGMHRVPLIGRICMDQCMIDVTGIDAAVGDTAILFGSDVRELIALSEHADTIPYETLCLISSRVRRVYVEAEPINKDTL